MVCLLMAHKLWVNKYISQPWNPFRSAGFRFWCSFSNSAVNFVDNIPRFFPWLWDSIKTGYPQIIFIIRNLVIVPWKSSLSYLMTIFNGRGKIFYSYSIFFFNKLRNNNSVAEPSYSIQKLHQLFCHNF